MEDDAPKKERLGETGFRRLVRTTAKKKGCGCGKKAQFIYPKKRKIKKNIKFM